MSINRPQIELDPVSATHRDVCNAINVLSARIAGLEHALGAEQRGETVEEMNTMTRYFNEKGEQ
jgi:hypothetical protein